MEAGELSDAAMMAAVMAGEERGLRGLYERHAPAMLRLIRRLTADRALAEEILQETWLAVWQHAGSFRQESSVRGWLLGVARRRAHDYVRRKVLSQAPLDEALAVPDPAEGIEATVLARAGHEKVIEAMRALPTELADTVVLALVEELPYREVAATLDIPVGTVKSRMALARRHLAATLTQEQEVSVKW